MLFPTQKIYVKVHDFFLKYSTYRYVHMSRFIIHDYFRYILSGIYWLFTIVYWHGTERALKLYFNKNCMQFAFMTIQCLKRGTQLPINIELILLSLDIHVYWLVERVTPMLTCSSHFTANSILLLKIYGVDASGLYCMSEYLIYAVALVSLFHQRYHVHDMPEARICMCVIPGTVSISHESGLFFFVTNNVSHMYNSYTDRQCHFVNKEEVLNTTAPDNSRPTCIIVSYCGWLWWYHTMCNLFDA